MDQERRRVRFHVTGEVQGVGFRATTRHKGNQLGLAGFVQNRADGGVEGEAEGAVAAVAAFTFWLHKGPPLARVARVDLEDLPPAAGAGATFEVRR
ncbi:MAG: acylphosphatase [Planctomycetes bacterium]|nr:acylphosphatase [Planctomycetota bacterium]